MRCERCGAEVVKYDVCDYCSRKICVNCVKSSKKKTKALRLVICRDCWGKMERRKTFKHSEISPSVAVSQQ